MYVEYNEFDHSGKQILHKVSEKRSRLGRGWVAMFKKPMMNLILQIGEVSLKTLLVLMNKQSYEPFIVISTTKIAEILHYNIRSAQRGVAELISMNLIRKVRVDGVNVFILNPMISICGTSTLAKRREIWDLLQRRDELGKFLESAVEPNVKLRVREQLAAIDRALKNAMDNRDVDETLQDVDLETGEIINVDQREIHREEAETGELSDRSDSANGLEQSV